MSSKSRRGFTLIEVLIVVVIMAVLAATIIPQFAASTQDAKDSQRDFNLHTLKSQIELYKVQHLGAYPTVQTVGGVSTLPQLTGKSKEDGTLDASGAFGPYILGELPSNPYTGSNSVSASTDGATTTGGGWLYDVNTGMVWADGPVVTP